jgi:hypothetical protein
MTDDCMNIQELVVLARPSADRSSAVRRRPAVGDQVVALLGDGAVLRAELPVLRPVVERALDELTKLWRRPME